MSLTVEQLQSRPTDATPSSLELKKRLYLAARTARYILNRQIAKLTPATYDLNDDQAADWQQRAVAALDHYDANNPNLGLYNEPAWHDTYNLHHQLDQGNSRVRKKLFERAVAAIEASEQNR